jgi:hypothetical protein
MDIQSERVAQHLARARGFEGGSRNGRTLKSPLFWLLGDVAIGFARECTLGKAEKVRSQFLPRSASNYR